jgi:lipoprotein NlpD
MKPRERLTMKLSARLSAPRFVGTARWIGALSVMVLAACANGPGKAPVEDRSVGTRPPGSAPAPGTVAAAEQPPSKVMPGAENAGKPGYYSVKPGDTLIRIGLDQGQNWRDIARWNGIENANLIEVGQVLRVAPPGAETAAAKPGAPNATPATGAVTKPVLPGAAAASAPAGTAPPPPVAGPREGDEDVNWSWPAAGPVATPFEEGRTKGLAITGKVGDAVLAAADGRVVYAGSGLRGYGNLIIIKHNATYLTAYAHNQALFVKEDQAVRRGQRIADMGATDAERVQLHFEVRRLGKPIDPGKLLPPR